MGPPIGLIILHSSVSTFDERLAEDVRVNRLEDSFLLWRSVCSSKFFARSSLILILNKCDLLKAKLQRGVQIRDSIPSFGDLPNDFETAVKCWFFGFPFCHPIIPTFVDKDFLPRLPATFPGNL